METHWMISLHQYTSLRIARIHTGPPHSNMISQPGEPLQRNFKCQVSHAFYKPPCCCHVIFSFLEHTGAATDDWRDIITVINYVLDVM